MLSNSHQLYCYLDCTTAQKRWGLESRKLGLCGIIGKVRGRRLRCKGYVTALGSCLWPTRLHWEGGGHECNDIANCSQDCNLLSLGTFIHSSKDDFICFSVVNVFNLVIQEKNCFLYEWNLIWLAVFTLFLTNYLTRPYKSMSQSQSPVNSNLKHLFCQFIGRSIYLSPLSASLHRKPR